MVRDRASHRADEPNVAGQCTCVATDCRVLWPSLVGRWLAPPPDGSGTGCHAVHVCASTHVRVCVCQCMYLSRSVVDSPHLVFPSLSFLL